MESALGHYQPQAVQSGDGYKYNTLRVNRPILGLTEPEGHERAIEV